MTVIYKQIHEAPPPIDGIPPRVQAVIDRALAKDPNSRYQSARDMTADLYRGLGLSMEGETIQTTLPRTPERETVSEKRRPARSPALIVGAVILACACLSMLVLSGTGVSLVSILPRLNIPGFASPMPMEETSLGVLRFQNATSTLDQITISTKLDAPAQGTQYEAWLISDSGEQRRSLGVLTENDSNQFVLTYVDGQSRNLLDGFSRMEITVEPNPDDSPNPSAQVAYSSALPLGALMHIRHLLVAIDETPNHIGMAVGLMNDASLIKKTADEMLNAYTAGDIQRAQADAEAIINLIVGKQDSVFHKDWNQDGTVSDPGDGYGLLLNGDQAGYIGGVIDHTELAANASDATSEIRMHSEHVVTCAQNVENWATQLRDIAVRIVQAESGQDIGADARSASALANQMLEGIDIDGNEAVDPIDGEGGAITAYEHADYMTDMPILAGPEASGDK